MFIIFFDLTTTCKKPTLPPEDFKYKIMFNCQTCQHLLLYHTDNFDIENIPHAAIFMETDPTKNRK